MNASRNRLASYSAGYRDGELGAPPAYPLESGASQYRYGYLRGSERRMEWTAAYCEYVDTDADAHVRDYLDAPVVLR